MVWGQASFDLADDVHHVGVALDHHQVLDFDAAGLANPAEVVASEVNEHHVLGPFLRVGKKFRFQFTILKRRPPSGAGTGDGAEAGPDTIGRRFRLDHHLWA